MTTKRKPRAAQLGVTDEQYERLLAAQGGHCAICPNEPKTRRLHVDHDHKTGAVRGLLCYRCNRFLHSWMENGWLRSAADYVDARCSLYRGNGLLPERVLDEINGTRQDAKP